MSILKTKKAGRDTWYLINKPVITDYSESNLGVFTADYIERRKASDELACDGRGFYLYDNTGELVVVKSTLAAVLQCVEEMNKEATSASR